MNYWNKKTCILEEVVAGGVTYKKMYRGNYNKNHKPHGFGIQYSFPDLFIGNFKNGKRHGYGIMNCREGYKLISKRGCKYMYAGIYIGIFKNNVFQHGKVIHFHRKKQEKSVYFIKKSVLNGEYRIFHQNHFWLFNYIDGELMGRYYYNGEYIVNSNLYYGEFHGTTTIITKKGCCHFLNYVNGIVEGKSIYYLPSQTFFILKWKNNICEKILCMRNRQNKLYNPQNILENTNVKVPREFECPVGYSIMIQPYVNEYKQTYEFKNLKLWMNHDTLSSEYLRDPMTNKLCHINSFKPNLSCQYKIFKFIEKKLFHSKIFLLK